MVKRTNLQGKMRSYEENCCFYSIFLAPQLPGGFAGFFLTFEIHLKKNIKLQENCKFTEKDMSFYEKNCIFLAPQLLENVQVFCRIFIQSIFEMR